MREIIFRGKTVNSGRWKYGYFLGDTVSYSACGIHDRDDTYLDVDRETVSQYTELTDKNGKQVFEGDILKVWKKSDSIGTYYYPPVEYPVNVVVKWDLCAWMWEVQGKERYYIHFPEAWCHYECEIIGNIWDDPELVEVEDGVGNM